MDARSDRDAELAVLAACFHSKTARDEARRHITGRDFDDPRHETLWDAMGRLDRHGKGVDAVTLPAVLQGDHGALEMLPHVATAVALPDNVAEYAAIVRSWSTKRQIEKAAHEVLRDVMRPEVNPVGFAASVATKFAGIRDLGVADEEFTAMTVAELLAQADDAPDWLIPGLLERRDRFMLTGEEGLGKSHLLRQIALSAAAGVHPFVPGGHYEPLRSLIIDCENTWSQVRRKIRPAAQWLSRYADPSENVMVDCTTRMDITRDKDLAWIHHRLDVWQPDIVVIGPLYRLVPRALQTDDDTVPVLAALDTIRDRGCALLIEAHAGHAIGKGGIRDFRPRGSSSLMGWPEFGYGMRTVSEGIADWIPWRGQREERDWPQRVRRADGFRWVPHEDLYGYGEAIEA